jgi:PhnB protein
MPDIANNSKPVLTTIAPWLSVKNSAAALAFYKAAFGATESFLLEDPDGAIVAKLSVNGAEFWLSDESPEHGNFSPATLGGGTVRMILTVANPEVFFLRALEAGATEVFPVREDYGWKLGRLVDPFGHHWEIGHPLNNE